jgi:hypothetical protein
MGKNTATLPIIRRVTCFIGLKKVTYEAKKENMELMPSGHTMHVTFLLETAAVKSGVAANNI